MSNELFVFKKQDSHYFLCCITWHLKSLSSLSSNKDTARPAFSAWLYIFLNHIGNYDSPEHFPFCYIGLILVNRHIHRRLWKSMQRHAVCYYNPSSPRKTH